MKLGLLADVRGFHAPLVAALDLLREEGCERVACLGSTAEGGDEDDATLALLRDAGALIVPSPHDVREEVTGLPPEGDLAGLKLAHACPVDSVVPETLFTTGFGVPTLMEVAEHLGSTTERRACGDLFAPLLHVLPADGSPAMRRQFLRPETLTVPEGSLLACPGSVTLSASANKTGCVMTWDDASNELGVIPFTTEGRVAAGKVRILVYCEEFAAHHPDPEVAARVDLRVETSADDILADASGFAPDLVVLDYHLAGEKTGLDSLLELCGGGEAPPVPVLSMAGNPADADAMKSSGAVGGLPFTFMKDALSRLIGQVAGS